MPEELMSDDEEKLNQASEWLTDPEATVLQKISAREHVMWFVQHATHMDLRKKAMSIVQGTMMLR
jgi:hypothetical protein